MKNIIPRSRIDAPRDMEQDHFDALLDDTIVGYCAGVATGLLPRSKDLEAVMGIDDPDAYKAAVDHVKEVVFGPNGAHRDLAELFTEQVSD